jgi:hypothetical protein
MTPTVRQDRRQFLKSAACVAASGWVVGRGAWADETQTLPSKSPNERLRFACIGVAGKGDGDSAQVAKFGDVIAICDIDEASLDRKGRQPGFEKSARFNDYRKMFDELATEISTGSSSSHGSRRNAIAPQ